MVNPEQFPGGEPEKKEMERSEIETRVHAAITRNQEVLRAVPEAALLDEYWEMLRREGQTARLRVSRTDGDPDDEQSEIYLLDEEGGYVELTYFAPDGSIGESFSVSLERIVGIES